MTNLIDDPVVQGFMEEYETKKGEYDKEQLETLRNIVKELGGFLEEDDTGAIFVSGRRLEDAGKGLQSHADNLWTRKTTYEILEEAVRQEQSNEQKESV